MLTSVRKLLPTMFLPTLWLALAVGALVAWVVVTPPLRIVARHMLPLAVGLGFLLAHTGLGHPLARRWFARDSRTEQLLVAAGLGMGITATVVFLLGLMAVMSPVVYLALTTLGLALVIRPVLDWLRHWTLPATVGVLDAVLLAVSSVFIVAAIPNLVAPEVSKDALEYHLLIPQLYLRNGVIAHLPLLVESCYPVMAELLYVPILALADPIVCKSYHFWVALAVLVVCGRIVVLIRGDESASGGSALLGPFFLLTMPVYAIHMAWAWNDFLFTFFTGLMVVSLLRRRLGDSSAAGIAHLILAGLMGGMASWVKYTFALPFMAVTVIMVVGLRRWRFRPVEIAGFYAAFGVVSLAWLGKNFAFTGNPVYPFLNEVFNSPYWPSSQADYIRTALHDYSFEWTPLTYLTFPLLLTLTPNFIELQTGIVPLLLLPLVFVPSRRPGMDLLKLFLVGYAFTWLVVHLELRSLLSLFLVLSAVGAVILEDGVQSWLRPSVARAAASLLLVAALASQAMTAVAVRHLIDPMPWFIGMESTDDYLRRQAPNMELFERLNAETTVGKVVLVGPREGFYLHATALFSSFADPPIAQVLSRRARSVAELAAQLRDDGVTHIVVDRERMLRDEEERLYTWSLDDRARFFGLLASECEVVDQAGSKVLLRLR